MKLLSTGFVRVDTLRPWTKASVLFPRYSQEQFAELNEYHAKHGDHAVLPIVITVTGEIVDGYNRYEAAKQAGAINMMAHTYQYADEAEQEIHAIVLNAKRRHLDDVIRAQVALRLAELYKPTAEEKRAAKQKAGQVGGKTAGRGRPKAHPQQCEPAKEMAPAQYNPPTPCRCGHLASVHRSGGYECRGCGCLQYVAMSDEDRAAESAAACTKCGHPQIDHHGLHGECQCDDGNCACCEFHGHEERQGGSADPGKGKKAKRGESATEKAAREVGVAPKTMKAVAKVKATGDQGLIDAMNAKLVGIDKAAKIADLPPEQREVALKVVRGELQKSIDGAQAMADGLRKENADVGIGACIEAGMILDKGMAKLALPKLETQHLETLIKALDALGAKVRGYALQVTQYRDRHDGKTIDVKASPVLPQALAATDPTYRTFPAEQRGKGSICLCGHHTARHRADNEHCELCECEIFETEQS